MINKRKFLSGCFFVFGALFLAVFPSDFVYAQNLTAEQRAQMEAELKRVEAEAAEAQKQLTAAQNQSASITRDIAVLTARIRAAELDIRAKNLLIQSLGNDIVNKEKHIGVLEDRIDDGKQTLADLLRKTNEVGSATLPEVILSQYTVSGFFTDVDSFQSLQQGLQKFFEQLRSDQAETSAEKDALDKRRAAELNARYEIEQQRKNIEADEKEKRRLLTISKGSEAAYKADLAAKQAQAAKIRATLFPLRGSESIPFGDAYKYALAASQATGIRPAFLLAIIQQESNLGANVGTCNRAGDPPSKHWSEIMPGPADKAAGRSRRDDQTVFKRIAAGLGVSVEGLPLSCPWGSGWGGAMGPAQFIPTTWEIFEDRISKALGGQHPDPWNPAHAFIASAMYLSDLGASAKTYTAERNAACRYYSGRACDSRSPANAFYGNQVLARADTIQRTMIDPLAGL